MSNTALLWAPLGKSFIKKYFCHGTVVSGLHLGTLSLAVDTRDIWREASDLHISEMACFILELDHGSLFCLFLA